MEVSFKLHLNVTFKKYVDIMNLNNEFKSFLNWFGS